MHTLLYKFKKLVTFYQNEIHIGMIVAQIRNITRVPHPPSSEHPIDSPGTYIALAVIAVVIIGFWLHSKWYFRKKK